MQKFEHYKKIQELKKVNRHCYGDDTTRKENPAEHSWSIAELCIIYFDELTEEFGALNLQRMLEMAIVHDEVEAIVGDASVWSPEDRIDKESKEMYAASVLWDELPAGLKQKKWSLFKEFENADTIESKIVKGFDRITPAIQRLVTGQGWFDVDGDVAKLDAIQLPRLSFSKTMISLYNQVKDEAVERGYLKQ